jgi:hypothetical protein
MTTASEREVAANDAYPHRNIYLDGGAYFAEERSRIPLREAFVKGAEWQASLTPQPRTVETVWKCAKCGHGSEEHGIENHPAALCVADMREVPAATPAPSVSGGRVVWGIGELRRMSAEARRRAESVAAISESDAVVNSLLGQAMAFDLIAERAANIEVTP